MTAFTSSVGPFYAKDSNGTMQKIKMVDLPNGIGTDDDLIAGYAYVEATGSTFDILSSSHDILTASHDVLTEISYSTAVLPYISEQIDYLTSSTDAIYNAVTALDLTQLSNLSDIKDGVDHLTASIDYVTQSVDNNTTYLEQILRFNRATHILSKVYHANDLFKDPAIWGDNVAQPIQLHSDSGLNPEAGTLLEEDYISKAIEVIIQNSTNKHAYLKVSYNPGSIVSPTDYTIKIPPGVIYNSESKVAHMRHFLSFNGEASSSFVGEVPVSITYNTSLNNNLTIGETVSGILSVTSIATNYYTIPFTPDTPTVIGEWYFDSGSFPGGFCVKGQARISIEPPQELQLYVTANGDNQKLFDKFVSINSETPTSFSLNFTGIDTPPSGRYELIAQGLGAGETGEARVLFADLLRYSE